MSRILSFMLLAASALIITACNGGGGGGGGDAGPDQGPDFGEGVVPPPWIDNAEFSPDGSPKCDLERWCDQPLFYYDEETEYFERVPPGAWDDPIYGDMYCFPPATVVQLDNRAIDTSMGFPDDYWSSGGRTRDVPPTRDVISHRPDGAFVTPWLLMCGSTNWAVLVCILDECVEYNEDGTLAESSE